MATIPFLAQQSGGMPTGSQTAGSRWAERITPSRANENGVNLLHGGDNSFNRKVWDGTADGNMLTLFYHSPDGEGGFPGAVDVRIEMTLTDDNAVRLEYFAESDEDTILSLTNHSYFNLRGEGEISDHVLTIDAGEYTPVDGNLIPTGEIAEVAGTPLDFTHPHLIGERIEDPFPPDEAVAGDTSHNFILVGRRFPGVRRGLKTRRAAA